MKCTNFVLSTVVLLGGFFSSLATTEAAIKTVTPSQDLNAVCRTLVPGDTLQLRGGLYRVALNKVIPSGSSWNLPITLMSFPGEQAIIQAPSGQPYVVNMEDGTQYVIFDRLVFDAVNVQYNCIKISKNSVGAPAAHHIRIQNSELKNSPFSCVIVTGGSNFCEFDTLDVHNNGKRLDSENLYSYGFYIKSANNSFRRMRVYENGSSGMQIFSTTPGVDTPDNNLVDSCDFSGNCVMSKAQGRGSGLAIAAGTGNRVVNSKANNNNIGFQISYSRNGEVSGNTAIGNRAAGLRIAEGSSGYKVQNNCVSGNHPDVENLVGTANTMLNNVNNGCGGSTPPATIPVVPKNLVMTESVSYSPGNPPTTVQVEPETRESESPSLMPWAIGIGLVLVLPFVFKAR